jgi:hypothetical protein
MTWTFEGIVTEFKTRLSLLSNWATTLYYGVYQRIIDLMAYAIEKLLYVAQFYYRESRWTQAQRIESLTQECDKLSYNYHRKIGAIGNLSISSSSIFDLSNVNLLNDVNILKWDTFTDSIKSSIVYATSDVVYAKNTIGNQLIPVREGLPKSFTYNAEGISSEIIYLYASDVDHGIDNDIVEVFIVDSNDNIIYTVNIVDNLYYINDLVNYYCTVKNTFDFTSVLITFGDGLTSPSLTAGQRILIKYAETLGDKGNIQASSSIVIINSTLFDAGGTDVTASLYVTNLEAITGGADFEGIESIRNNAPHLFQSGYRAGCNLDWLSIINSVPYIYKSTIWTVDDIGGSSLLPEQNTVFVTAVTTTGDDLTDAQRDDIETNYLKERKSPTETITWKNLEKIYTYFNIIGKITNQTSAVVHGAIVDAIHNAYSTLHTDFQTNIFYSNAMALISSVPNVKYHVSTLNNMEKNLPKTVISNTILPSMLPSETTTLTDQVLLVPNSLVLWLKQKSSNIWGNLMQIGHDLSGVILNDMPSSFSITQGYVTPPINTYSYTLASVSGSGVLELGIQNPEANNPDGYLIYISYQTKDGNGDNINSIRMSKRYQITDVDEDFIKTELTYL